MKPAVAIIGIGEIGGVFARGLLKAGYPVFPVNRGDDIHQAANVFPEPALVLVTVGEADLHPTLDAIPAAWRDRLALIQNELLPADWQAHDLANPTVASIWFEKKKGQDVKVLVPTPVYGPGASILAEALDALGIAWARVSDADRLLFELVRKNLYILTTNICGLRTGGTVQELWSDHEDLARAVFAEILQLESVRTGSQFDADALLHAVLEAFEGDPAHKCMGRSAPARLARALEGAAKYGVAVPTLEAIAREQR
ncbi:MAG: hypothetical protein P8Y64_09130 [Gammaproteobacteria bacterium]|jgi:hypothetical protein